MAKARTALFGDYRQNGKVAIEDMSVTTGRRFFVQSTDGTDNTAHGDTPDAPFATIDYAIGKCTASAGDIIYVMPGHAENLTAATSINCDVIGVSIIGLGSGSLMPTLSTTAAAGSITIATTNVTLKNLKLVANFATGTTTGITIAEAGDYCTLDGLVFRDTSAANEFLIHISVATTVTDLTIKNCDFATAAGTMSSSVFFVGTTQYLRMLNNRWFCDCSASVIDHLADIPTYCWLEGNKAVNVDSGAGLCLSLKSDGAATGFLGYNSWNGNKGDAETMAATNDFWVTENYNSNTINASGVLNPAAGAIP